MYILKNTHILKLFVDLKKKKQRKRAKKEKKYEY